MQGSQCSTSVKSYFKELLAQTLQQTLPEKTFKPNYVARVAIWLGFSVLFFTILMILDHDYKTIKTATVEYNTPQEETLVFNLEEMKPPVYVYYELDNYYQNHRRYLKSRNNDQLKGNIVKSESALTDCDPLIVADSHKSGPSKFFNPCGLVAASWFGDKNITVERLMLPEESIGIQIRTSRISWEADREVRFQSPSDYEGEFPIIEGRNFTQESFQDESFMNWMRISGLPRFRKLYGIIDTKIAKGKYSMNITSVVDVKKFDGKKYIVFATAGKYTGGPNYSLIVFVGICFVISIFNLFFTMVPSFQKYCKHKEPNKKTSFLLVGTDAEP